MPYRLSKKEMRIMLEARNESRELYKNDPNRKKNKYRAVKSSATLLGIFLILMLFVYFLVWLGGRIGGFAE